MSIEYDNYINEHKELVAKAFYWLEDNVPEIFKNKEISSIGELERQICDGHDYSKKFVDEYKAYDNYFYGKDKSYKAINDFNKAWLIHIHRNPHHWQYWVLLNDDPNEKQLAIDMPYNYIIEMICDWWSFSWKNGDLYEIFDWYKQHKNIILSEYTKHMVDYILNMIKSTLDYKGYSKGDE